MQVELDRKVLAQAQAVAIDAIIKASEAILAYWPNPTNSAFDRSKALTIIEKQEGVGNFATIADTASENLLIDAIRSDSILKDHDIQTEETDLALTGSEYRWINDPIDGTLNFTNGLPDFAISMGLLYRLRPVLGVIALPERRQLVIAQEGGGAHLLTFEGNHLADLRELVEAVTLPLRKSIVSYDVGYEDRKGQFEDYVVKFADHVGAPTSYYSCVTAQVKLAQGLIGAYIMREPKLFDIAGCATVLSESGCPVSGMDGEPIDWSAPKRTILAARNAEIHSQLVELLNAS